MYVNKVESELTASGQGSESLDSMLRRFKRKVLADGILDEIRRRQFFMNKSQKRKEKSKRARITAIKERKKNYRDF